MNLRIHRTFEWVTPSRPLGEIRFGGPPPAKVLKATDTLQLLDVLSGEWKAVPIVEEAKPSYPQPVDRHPANRFGHFEALGRNPTQGGD